MLEKTLSPIQIKQIDFPNRIVMAPMYPFGWLGKDGVMPEKTVSHYLKRADAGIGMMICHALLVSAINDGGERTGIYSDDQIPALAAIAEACHRGKTKTKFIVQLAYSAGDEDEDIAGCFNALPAEKLEGIRDAFIQAALRCKKAGCDGIELHGAHGFWLNTAASATQNKRLDAYGGDLHGRLKLARDTIRGIQAFADDTFIIGYRMGWSEDTKTDKETAKALESCGVELLHISSGIPEDRQFEIPGGFDYNRVVAAGCAVKKAVNIPVIVVNDIKTLARGETLLQKELCDFVAYGKPFLADSKFAVKSLKDQDYEACLICGECQWGTDGDFCPRKIETENAEQA